MHTLAGGAQMPCNRYTAKTIRRIYGRIAGNQLPGHVPLFLTVTRKIISHGMTGKSKVVLPTAA